MYFYTKLAFRLVNPLLSKFNKQKHNENVGDKNKKSTRSNKKKLNYIEKTRKRAIKRVFNAN